MSIKYAILGLLQSKALHGYRIKQLIERDFGAMWTVNFGQIYPTLKRLQAEGLVTSKQVPQPNSPPRKLYTITRNGRLEFRRWLTRSPEKNAMLRDPFLVRFPFFAYGPPERARELTAEQIALYERQLEKRQESLLARSRAGTYAGLVADLGIELNETMLRWLRRAQEELRENRGRKRKAAKE